jgi:UDP-glucose 4-epimerase
VGTGIGTSNAEIVRIIGEIFAKEGGSVRTKVLPERRFDVAANILASTKLAACSGWKPQISLEDGLARVWQASKRQKKI